MTKAPIRTLASKYNRVLLALAAAASACCFETTQAAAAAGNGDKTYTEDELRRSDWINEGMEKFNSACTYCHGQKGQGGKVKSFTERSGWKPEAIHNVITNGRVRGSNVMPPWGGSMPDEDIWKLVAYIKSLSVDFKGPVPPP